MKQKLSSAEIITMYNQFIANTYDTLPVNLTRGKGIYVYDAEGNQYLDFWAAYSALNLGHGHPQILDTAKRHLDSGALLTRACYNDQLALLGKELTTLTGLDMMLPKNSGVEAFEAAVKTARMYAYRKKEMKRNTAEIIVCTDNFHGRTLAAISCSSEPQYRDDFGPHTPGFKLIPYNDPHALENAINKNTIAFLVEPVQGEGGIIVPSNDYLKTIREICDRENILLLLDEIQTGLGRTGGLFCFKEAGIIPDILIVGKSLGGGIVPISAIVGSRKILQYYKPGDDGSTFGGYSFACAVARKALKIVQKQEIPKRAHELGIYAIEQLRQIKSPYIKVIRGKGLMIGIELKPEAGGARRFCEALLKEGVICKEAHHHVLRLSPPLIISKEQLSTGLEKIEKVLTT
ncbi:ornithine--oxo-acid transaminase [Patescibacteria group bacterium AH-259-L05]|nr:ornithine--oxo-acid transaminase [Patescibacteria group bacterium AH-259-L05]